MARGRYFPVGLTFDDGYADFATTAVPILRRYGFTATVYVLADRLGGVNEWDQGAPRERLMTAVQVRAVASAGMEVGFHGLRHAGSGDLRVRLPWVGHEAELRPSGPRRLRLPGCAEPEGPLAVDLDALGVPRSGDRALLPG
jgi:hypothetical protein